MSTRPRFFNVYTISAILLSGIAAWWFFFMVPGFGPGRTLSIIGWLKTACNAENDYEHAWMVPPIMAFMLWHARDKLEMATKRIDWRGLLVLGLGVGLYLMAFRTSQARVGAFALPVVMLGGAWYLCGARVAGIVAFPLLFFWMSIPLPSFQQATVWLQLIATQAGHLGSALFGVETYVQGTNILSPNGKWDAYNIAGGCSGMRSLMALTMIAAAWAYVADIVWWKKIILFASAIPLAVIGNSVRIASIFVFADYVSPVFASKTWHDWSGLLFFFPVTLVGLSLLHAWLAGEIKSIFRGRRRAVIRRNTQSTTTEREQVHGN